MKNTMMRIKVCNADERGDSMCKMREVECIDDTKDGWMKRWWRSQIEELTSENWSEKGRDVGNG